MTKKKSSKGSHTQVNENRGGGNTQPAPTKSKKRTMDEIDEIFSSKQNKKAKPTERTTDSKGKRADKKKKNIVARDGQGQSHNSSKSKNEKGMSVRKNKLPDDGDLFGDSAKPQKKLGGMKIYTEEELGLNRADAGNTPLCPFDCDCCF